MANAAISAAGLAQIALDKSRQLATVRAGELKHPHNWLRGEQNKEELAALGRDYLEKPINLILVRPDGTVLDGNRRLEGILIAEGPDAEVQVIVTTEEITEAILLEIQLQTSEHSKSLKPYELYQGCSDWLRISGATARDMAAKIHKSEGMVSIILSLSKCLPSVHEAAKAGKIGPSDWYAISKSPDQQATLDLIMGGASREERKRAVRKPQENAVRASSIKCPLPSGHVVTIKGDDLSLEEAVEVLATASKAIKEGIRKNFTAKTFQAAAKDIAAAG